MFDEDEFHKKIKENLNSLGGRPLHPEGADLLGGYPLSLEAKFIRAEQDGEKRKTGRFLGRRFGKDIDKEVKEKYKAFFAVRSATFYRDEVVKGSTPFYIVAANEILRNHGLRTATPADLGKIIDKELLDLKGVFVDSALVLRSIDRPNKYLAKNLRKQIRSRIPYKVQLPIMIPLSDLELEKDQDSRYGLAFKLKEGAISAKLIYAPQLKHKNNYKRFSKTDETGRPIFDKKGERTLHTRNSGLSRLYLSENNLYSDFNYLDCSGAFGAGRIVIVNE